MARSNKRESMQPKSTCNILEGTAACLATLIRSEDDVKDYLWINQKTKSKLTEEQKEKSQLLAQLCQVVGETKFNEDATNELKSQLKITLPTSPTSKNILSIISGLLDYFNVLKEVKPRFLNRFHHEYSCSNCDYTLDESKRALSMQCFVKNGLNKFSISVRRMLDNKSKCTECKSRTMMRRRTWERPQRFHIFLIKSKDNTPVVIDEQSMMIRDEEYELVWLVRQRDNGQWVWQVKCDEKWKEIPTGSCFELKNFDPNSTRHKSTPVIAVWKRSGNQENDDSSTESQSQIQDQESRPKRRSRRRRKKAPPIPKSPSADEGSDTDFGSMSTTSFEIPEQRRRSSRLAQKNRQKVKEENKEFESECESTTTPKRGRKRRRVVEKKVKAEGSDSQPPPPKKRRVGDGSKQMKLKKSTVQAMDIDSPESSSRRKRKRSSAAVIQDDRQFEKNVCYMKSQSTGVKENDEEVNDFFSPPKKKRKKSSNGALSIGQLIQIGDVGSLDGASMDMNHPMSAPSTPSTTSQETQTPAGFMEEMESEIQLLKETLKKYHDKDRIALEKTRENWELKEEIEKLQSELREVKQENVEKIKRMKEQRQGLNQQNLLLRAERDAWAGKNRDKYIQFEEHDVTDVNEKVIFRFKRSVSLHERFQHADDSEQLSIVPIYKDEEVFLGDDCKPEFEKESLIESVSRHIKEFGMYKVSNKAEVREIAEHGRVKELEGNYGAFANTTIKCGEVIDRYFADELLEADFDCRYGQTAIYDAGCMYAFDVEDGYLNEENESCSYILDAYRVSQEEIHGIPMTFVNDCREDICGDCRTPDDILQQNALMLTFRVNGYGMMFVMATDDIEEDEEIVSFYGEAYARLQRRYQRSKEMKEREFHDAENR